MDSPTFLDNFYPIFKQHWLTITLGALGLIFLVYGLIVLLGSSSSSKDVIFESGNEAVLSSESSSKSLDRQIIVDVEGAVLKPGVHNVPTDSRIQDALIAAGGFSLDADREWVTKNLNLAIKVTDGTKIYIPKIGETETGSINGIKSIKGGNAEDQVNINTASQQELDSLPGIGPIYAEKIINGRPYGAIDELLSKKIVGSKVFEEIREKITVY
ncbi:MAG: hypothetical protein A3D74_00175 [Candidatus Levybacteria bacterium RIFCSPHIGHO2_02_FULL_37_13]|nr:MAG: hypothetical protein A3D74_00175 [Candidatus Levybacteria bacterium RIFCSPHIGHO2_02_FULL_37_13]OGH29729.1 MAG: hypothetical protein A3E40_02880 [Candidatus Levybacteria bacterium RIFCSPHIGHO2_12_FULL_37_9]OGH39398.1 MAG: hypothetical protein A3B41_01360 [Candidatus Levybacteria bacterium RIFCSPLOWO2_01_FULL_37_26]